MDQVRFPGMARENLSAPKSVNIFGGFLGNNVNNIVDRDNALHMACLIDHRMQQVRIREHFRHYLLIIFLGDTQIVLAHDRSDGMLSRTIEQVAK